MTIYDMAESFGTSATTVRRWAKKAGVTGKADKNGFVQFNQTESNAIKKAGENRAKPGPKK